MKKSIGLILVGMALILTLQWGWNQFQSEAVAIDQPVHEMWARYGTPEWENFEKGMCLMHNKGYRIKGYSVVLNNKGDLVKFAVAEAP